MTNAILTLNAGSSCIKFAVFPVQGGEVAAAFAEGEADWTADAPDEILRWFRAHSAGLNLIGAGHRVVNGGPAFMWMTRLLQAADEFVTEEAEGASAPGSHKKGS